MSYSRVKAYRKKDGTAVRAHQRRDNNRQNTPSVKTAYPLSLIVNEEINVSEIKQSGTEEVLEEFLEFRRDYNNNPDDPRFLKNGKKKKSLGESFVDHLKESKNLVDEKTKLMMIQAAETGWVAKPHKSKDSLANDSTSTSTVTSTGFGTVEAIMHLPMVGKNVNLPVTLHFFPRVSLKGQELSFHSDIPGVNLQDADLSNTIVFSLNAAGANLRNTNWDGSTLGRFNFDGADLEGANFTGLDVHGFSDVPAINGIFGSFKGANLHNINLTKAKLKHCDLSGCDLTSAKLDQVILPKDLTDVFITDDQFENMNLYGYSRRYYQYKKNTFESALKQLGVSEKQFEFLILSGGIKVRDNQTNERVSSNFNPDSHHIPMWEIENTKKYLAEQK